MHSGTKIGAKIRIGLERIGLNGNTELLGTLDLMMNTEIDTGIKKF